MWCNKVLNSTRKRFYLYSGIDRIVNNDGYISNNVLPCCFRCNRMKGELDHDEFLAQVEKIFKFSGSILN